VDVVAAEVVSVFEARRIACLLLKGASTARFLYDTEGEREYGDVDLLVAPEAFERAGAALGELGFVRFELPVLDRHEHHADSWHRSADRADVDLHRTLPWVGAAAETVWSELSLATEPMAVGGAPVRVLAPPALALELALHAVTHAGERGRPLEELELAVARLSPGVWRGARVLAERLDALPGLRAGLELVPAGPALARELELGDAVSRDVELAAFGPPGALQLRRTWTLPWRKRLAVLARQVVPPREYMHRMAPSSRRGRVHLLLAHVRRLAAVGRRLPSLLQALVRARG
jgi:hypothetical protein